MAEEELLHSPAVPFTAALVCGGAAVLTTALVESLRSRINDNICVGVTAAVTATAVHALVVGL